MSEEYIKRDDVLNLFDLGFCESFPYGCGKCSYQDECTVGQISTIPAADAVHVVRCGQCRYRFNCAPADSEFGGFGPDDFCSRGVADLEVETDEAD